MTADPAAGTAGETTGDTTVDAAGEPVLTAAGLSVHTSTGRLLDDVTLTVRAGELLAIVGPNGAGKSTLLAALAGDRPAPRTRTTGEVSLFGRPVGSYRPGALARLRAVLPQSGTPRFPFTVSDVVRLGRAPWPPDRDRDDAAVGTALAIADVAHLTARRCTDLSGGEQARVSLARVLAQDAPVLLLDEPTAALDLRHTENVLMTARRMADAGRAVVVVVHDLNLAAVHATTVAVLAGGRLRALGSPAEALTSTILTETYDHPVTVIDHPLRPVRLVLPGGLPAGQPLPPQSPEA
ncbi:heme ABC transporter ATP-binding protein [Parafrankia sp. FMc2]|uniref:heme ABC transporter ATP-binding protein n=1 Tax=Parafrankia sp. FMc2 TaxID=3233196 RepID=UPI0034D65796